MLQIRQTNKLNVFSHTSVVKWRIALKNLMNLLSILLGKIVIKISYFLNSSQEYESHVQFPLN